MTSPPEHSPTNAPVPATKAEKAKIYRLKLKETLDQAALEESRRKNRCGLHGLSLWGTGTAL